MARTSSVGNTPVVIIRTYSLVLIEFIYPQIVAPVHALPGYLRCPLSVIWSGHQRRIPSGIEYEQEIVAEAADGAIHDLDELNGIGGVSAIDLKIVRHIDRTAKLGSTEVHLTKVGAFVAGITEIVQPGPFCIHCYGSIIDIHVRMFQIVRGEQHLAEMRQHLRHDLPVAFHRTVDRTVTRFATNARLVPHFGGFEPSSAPFDRKILCEAVRDDLTRAEKASGLCSWSCRKDHRSPVSSDILSHGL